MEFKIISIELKNFKNVKNGKIEFTKNRSNTKGYSNVLGIYGQNGSGKTAVVEAFSILKSTLEGEEIFDSAERLIFSGEQVATLKFSFEMTKLDESNYIEYELSIERKSSIDKGDSPIFYKEEILRHKDLKSKSRLKDILKFNASTENDFLFPFDMTKMLAGKSKDISTLIDLKVAKQLAYKEGTSFIFSTDSKKIINKDLNPITSEIIQALSGSFVRGLYILKNSDSGLIYANILLPLSFRIAHGVDGTLEAGGIIALPSNHTHTIPESFFIYAKEVLDQINVVLPTIIPDLTIEIRNLGEKTTDQGDKGVQFELLSHRGPIKIPFQNESDGVKKLVAMLSVLIAMFNSPNVHVVIDELDAGIFEFLLGELIEVLCENGQGQLLFTSHNLRLLEVMPKENLWFTTTNPEERYIKLTGIKKTNNVRDVYMRAIQLGGQKEEVYSETDSFEISKAFRKAGVVHND